MEFRTVVSYTILGVVMVVIIAVMFAPTALYEKVKNLVDDTIDSWFSTVKEEKIRQEEEEIVNCEKLEEGECASNKDKCYPAYKDNGKNFNECEECPDSGFYCGKISSPCTHDSCKEACKRDHCGQDCTYLDSECYGIVSYSKSCDDSTECETKLSEALSMIDWSFRNTIVDINITIEGETWYYWGTLSGLSETNNKDKHYWVNEDVCGSDKIVFQALTVPFYCRGDDSLDLRSQLSKARTTTELLALVDSKLYGTVTSVITDEYTGPVKNAEVLFEFEGNVHKTTTNHEGYYEFPFEGDTDKGFEGEVQVVLQYKKDDKTYFKIYYENSVAWLKKNFKINNVEDLKQDILFEDNLGSEYEMYPKLGSIRHFSVMYFHFAEVLEAYKDSLNINFDNNIPLDVFTFVDVKNPYYGYPQKIVMNEEYSNLGSGHIRGAEWHEFSHYAMYTMYGKWPKPKSGLIPDEENHAGYINPSTSDSYVEGFAEFMEGAIANNYGYDEPNLRSLGYESGVLKGQNLELDYNPWESLGKAEELSISGILWDIYDGKNDDPIDMTFGEVWDVLKDYHADFSSVYNSFIAKYPDKKDDINNVFKSHGFFADTTEGNKKWDDVEPHIDENNNGVYDAGEHFVDYAEESGSSTPGMIYQDGEKIGQATNYERTERTYTVELPGHYIKVDNEVPFYNVEITFPDNPELDFDFITNNQDGVVYVQVPPEAYNARIKVTGKDVSTGNPLTFTSEEFYNKYPESVQKGYFVEHDFQVTGQIPTRVAAPETLPDTTSDIKPFWETRGEEGDLPEQDVIEEISESDQISVQGEGQKKTKLYLGVLAIAGIMFILLLVFIIRKKKKPEDISNTPRQGNYQYSQK